MWKLEKIGKHVTHDSGLRLMFWRATRRDENGDVTDCIEYPNKKRIKKIMKAISER